ncbi:molecular chaperone DnaJ [Balneolaceae bacterium ANBcel3]|nr:molecular chaperone DnaJ [Balneolaceae bacterium ANBcel3]
MSKRDYYEILGVSKTATEQELKRSYRKLAMKYHPDRNPDNPDAEKKFKEAAEAFDVLKDPDKRARYDQFGHAGVSGGGFGGGADFQDFGFEDIFSRFSDIFGGDAFSGMGGAQGRTRRGARTGRPGDDMKITLTLDLEEIAFGIEKEIKVKKYVVCDSCKGLGAETDQDYMTCGTCNGVGEVRQVARTMFGQVVNVQACPTCHGEGKTIKNKCKACSGEGRVRGEETIKIKIPAGVSKGNYISLRGQGHAGIRKGEAGTLIVLIEEKKHEYFTRDGDDILFDLNLSIPDAALGLVTEVPTLKGKAKIKIEPGTQPGKMLRMREKGIKGLNSNIHGDQYVRVQVFVPVNLNDEEKKALETFRESKNFDPNKHKGFRDNLFDRVKAVFS